MNNLNSLVQRVDSSLKTFPVVLRSIIGCIQRLCSFRNGRRRKQSTNEMVSGTIKDAEGKETAKMTCSFCCFFPFFFLLLDDVHVRHRDHQQRCVFQSWSRLEGRRTTAYCSGTGLVSDRGDLAHVRYCKSLLMVV